MNTADSAFAQTEANFKNQMDRELSMIKSVQVELEAKGFRASVKKALHQMDTDTIEIHWGDLICSQLKKQ